MISRYMFLICLSFFSMQAGANWREEVLQNHTNFYLSQNASVAVNGTPHIFYKGRYLYHAYLDNGNWLQEKLDSQLDFYIPPSGSNGQVAATVGPDNRIHVIYRSNNQRIKYAVGNTGNWTVRETPLIVGRGSNGAGDIAVDSTGRLHVIHVAENSALPADARDYIEHAIFDGSSWQLETIDSSISSQSGYLISVEIDSNDNIHTIYGNTVYPVESFLYYQVYTAGNWTRSTVAHGLWGTSSFDNIKLLLQADNSAKVCYYFADNGAVGFYCASLVNTVWEASQVVLDNGGMDSCSLRLNLESNEAGDIYGVRQCSSGSSNYQQFFSYINDTWNTLDSASYENGGSPVLIQPVGTVPYAFVLSPVLGRGYGNAYPLVEYHLENDNAVYNLVAERNDYPVDFGAWPYLVSDNNDVFHASFKYIGNWHSYVYGDLDNWSVSTFNSQYYADTQLKFSPAPNGNPHFFIRAHQSYDSKHIELDSSGNIIDTNFLPEPINSGQTPAAFIDSNGYAHLAYLDASTWTIKYATNSSGLWTIETAYALNYTSLEEQVFSDKVQYDDYSYAVDLKINGNRINIAFVEWHVDNSFNYTSKLVSVVYSLDQWRSRVLAQSEDKDQWQLPAIDIDGNNRVHLTYNLLKCPALCYPAGIIYGTNASGSWVDKKISVESIYIFHPENYPAADFWVTGLGSDVSVNEQGDAVVSYIHGSDDISASNQDSITSNLRVVKIDSCMPVSQTIRTGLSLPLLTHSSIQANGYLDSAIDSQGLSAVAFYDMLVEEPHIMIEESGLLVRSCVEGSNSFRVEITNNGSNSARLTNTSFQSYEKGNFSVLRNSCSSTTLSTGNSCFVDIEGNLPPTSSEVDYLFNTDSTLYLNLEFEELSVSGPSVLKASEYIIDTNAIRPEPAPGNDNAAASSGGGSGGTVSPFTIFIMALWLFYIHRRSHRLSKY